MLSTATRAPRLSVVYHFMSQASRLISSARFKSTDDLRNDEALKTEWEERNKKFAAKQGPDVAGADIAIMYVHILICKQSY
jgi:hypothetical protein